MKGCPIVMYNLGVCAAYSNLVDADCWLQGLRNKVQLSRSRIAVPARFIETFIIISERAAVFSLRIYHQQHGHLSWQPLAIQFAPVSSIPQNNVYRQQSGVAPANVSSYDHHGFASNTVKLMMVAIMQNANSSFPLQSFSKRPAHDSFFV